MRLTAVFLLTLALAGCVSAGTKVTDAQAQQFQKGVTTEADVIKTLGTPTASAHLSNGQAQLTYTYVEGRPDAIDYVPVVGLLAGGATAHSTGVVFTFGTDGKLAGYDTIASDTSTHTGIIN